jgi:hypothetical protein
VRLHLDDDLMGAVDGRQIGLDGPAVRLPMALEHRGRGRFEFRGMALEVGARAAAALRRMTRELDAVNGKHLAADHALSIADR